MKFGSLIFWTSCKVWVMVIIVCVVFLLCTDIKTVNLQQATMTEVGLENCYEKT